MDTEFAKLQATVTAQAKEIERIKESLKKIQRRTLLPNHIIDSDEFESCKALLESDFWPPAVEPSLICDVSSEQDKLDRAEGILEFIITQPLNGLKFLDFGCGEGHVVDLAKKQNVKSACGFDIEASPQWDKWEKENNILYTTDWEKVKNNGPYDVVLIYDVLDHIQGDEPVVIDCLHKIRRVTSPDTKIFVRCHPWCSRHATHLYREINKAYIHLVFTQNELKSMGFHQQSLQKIIHPYFGYSDWFKQANFQQINERTTTEPIEPFFYDTPIIANRIKKHWEFSFVPELRTGQDFPVSQLEQQWNDWILI